MDADPIAAVDAIRLRIPFTAGTWATARPAADGPGPRAPVDSLLIRVTTAAGLRGWGEALAFEAAPLAAAAVTEVLAAGFPAVKLHERDVAVVYAARAAAGTAGLILDVNCAWPWGLARQRAIELAGAGLTWLEEPLWPPEDHDGLARLRAAVGVPLAAGENVTALHDFDRLMGGGAVDVVQPSPAKMGGVSELTRVIALAAARGVTVVPHTYYHGPALLAALHVMAALGPPDALVEWRYSPLAALPLGPALLPDRGRLAVPQGPGLGLDPDPDVLAAYARP